MTMGFVLNLGFRTVWGLDVVSIRLVFFETEGPDVRAEREAAACKELELKQQSCTMWRSSWS